ncbi:MAG: macro domain-containing protein [Candidatus Brocadiia bacterium]
MSSLTIDIRKGDITTAKAAAIASAANSLGRMGGGVALAIRRAGGTEIEDEAKAQAPIPVGHAVATSAGRLPFRYVIHAPTMRRPRQRAEPDNVGLATRAAIETADRLGCESLAIPGMGTKTGHVPHSVAARQMLEAIEACKTTTLRHIVLVDIDNRMVEAWRKARSGEPQGGKKGSRRGDRSRGKPRTRAPARRRNRSRTYGRRP